MFLIAVDTEIFCSLLQGDGHAEMIVFTMEEVPSLEIFMVRLDEVLSNLIWLGMSLLSLEKLN